MQSLKAFQKAFRVDLLSVGLDEFAKDGALVRLIRATNEWIKDNPEQAKKEEIEPLGETLYFKPLTSAQLTSLQQAVVGADGKQRNMHNVYAKWVSVCWTNEDGEPIASAKEAGDMVSAPLQELFVKVQEINGQKIESMEEAGKD